jgi:hypothetical protein
MSSLLVKFDCSNELTLWYCHGGPVTQQHAVIRKRLTDNAFLAQAGLRGEEPTKYVILKLGREASVGDIQREADFYDQDLFHLQGKVIPKLYGLYKGKDGKHDVACLLLEYCSGASQLPLSELG